LSIWFIESLWLESADPKQTGTLDIFNRLALNLNAF